MTAASPQAAADVVARRIAPRKPKVAIVLGSGLGFLADRVEGAVRVPYADIPGFPEPGVAGHKGELVAGNLGGVPVLVQAGRFHLYEGHDAVTAGLPVRVFSRLGITTLVVTNASGGIRAGFGAGTLMLLSDHLNLMFRNPLIGPVIEGEERFPDLTEAYDAKLRKLAKETAARLKVPLEEGVYAALLGPSYETPAEVRMLRNLGADAVGMSTVPEVVVARARGMRCLGFSIVTNPAAGLSGETLSHEEVLAVGLRAGTKLGDLVTEVVRRLDG
ncbi:MAG TPA: purine-nucleoside phosphorylase [Gemmatimonadales bacterium]|nr:purine-nucleoside phosphorylase [Gemmatimonadales bacterium]